MGYLNLYKATNNPDFLKKSKSFVAPLIEMSSPLKKGLGWGMKHRWMTISGIIPEDTPCNTQTSYVYEYFMKLSEIHDSEKYDEYLQKIAWHVANDFHEWQIGDTLACSYSTVDRRRVVNANSYRALMLIDAGKRFDNSEYLTKGIATLKYVINMQNKDGSWPYAEDQSFVDTYHTCFVLKNLYKIKKILGDDSLGIDQAIEKGLKYYFLNLFNDEGIPIPFSVKPRLTLHKYDSYDIAESIGLLAELNIENKIVTGLINFVKTNFQTKKGWFIFRIYPFVKIKGIPYMRYANSAMFLALTKVIKRGISNNKNEAKN